MEYFVRRGSEEYGPYTLADLRRFSISGHLAAGDGVRAAEESVVHPASRVLGAGAWPPAAGVGSPGGGQVVAAPAYQPAYQLPSMQNGAPLPPNLHWATVLLLSVATCGVFPLIWGMMQAWWARQLVPGNRSIWYMASSLGIVYLPALLIGMLEPFLPDNPDFQDAEGAMLVAVGIFAVLLMIASIVLWIAGIFAIHGAMETYFMETEMPPEPLALNVGWTFVGGMYYLQWHMSRIHRWKMHGSYE